MTDALTLTESSALADHERVIEQGLSNFIAVGNALLAIREGRLYRVGYATFDSYLLLKWGISRQQAGRLISASVVGTDLSPIGSVPNENVARELGRIKDDDLRRTVWTAAAGTFGADNVTATIVKATKTVIETAEITSGHVDVSDGRMTPLAAAITAETNEIIQRQRQHIIDSGNPPLFKEKMFLGQLTPALVSGLIQEHGDVEVRVIVYEVKDV